MNHTSIMDPMDKVKASQLLFKLHRLNKFEKYMDQNLDFVLFGG